MVGPKPAVVADSVLNKLIQYDIYENGKIKKRSDLMWKNICEELNNLIKPINLFFMVQQDRHNILTYYNKIKNIRNMNTIINNNESKKENNEESIEPKEEISFEYAAETILSRRKSLKKPIIEFEVELTVEEWNEISPIKKHYKDGREKEILKEGWADILVQAIWRTYKLPCAFNFKRHLINAYNYINIEGYCTVCSNTITAICYSAPKTNDNCNFVVNTCDSRGIPHTRKRKLCGPQREKIKQELYYKKPKQWRRDFATKNLVHGDQEPAVMYKLPALQKAAQDIKNDKLGIKKGSDLFESLSALKRNVEYRKFIKNIGFDKFFIMYCSPEQISLTNDIMKFLGNSLSLDATASVVKQVDRLEDDSNDLFLTILSTFINNEIVPVAQVISEINDTNFYLYWLNELQKYNLKTPHEIVTDMGKALQNAVSLSFNNMTYQEYNNHCLAVILKQEDLKAKTLLRIDIAHLVHAVSRWPCIKNSNLKAIELFKSCVGFMSTIENFENFIDFIRNLFMLVGSDVFDDDCSKALNYIVDKIQTFKFVENIHTVNNLMDTSENENAENSLKKNTKISHFIEQIEKNVQSNKKRAKTSKFHQENNYYSPEFLKNFKNLLKEFPFWINIMRLYFQNTNKVATSARAECYFGQIKSTILEDKKPLRVDKFIVKHIQQINADIKIAQSAFNNAKPAITKKPNGKKSNNSHLFISERWKNKYSVIEKEDTTESFSIVNEDMNLNFTMPKCNDSLESENKSYLHDHSYSFTSKSTKNCSYSQFVEQDLISSSKNEDTSTPLMP